LSTAKGMILKMNIKEKAPFKVLYSNDTTNILTCKSPFNPQPAQQKESTGKWVEKPLIFTREMLEATVDETADTGIDVHMLQPGVGWVPWWKSDVYPFEEHIKFMKKHTGMTPSDNGFAEYMANGGDMVKVFVDRCRFKGLTPFISFRLNDSHGHEFTAMEPEKIPGWAWHVFCPTHVEHPEWRFGSDLNDWNSRVLNWAIQEVRDAKFAYIKEIIENYDIDGFELDFMRHCNFFRQEETTGDERRRIITTFVKDVRKVLDDTAKPGVHRWLCVRIPAQVSWYDKLGISIEDMTQAGVEMFNLSNYYYTEDRGDFKTVRSMAGENASLYFELCHTVHQRKEPDPEGVRIYDNTLQRRTTPVQYYTAAYLAQSRGSDGCSTFNFVYYRQHGIGERGPATEPPFFIHKGLGTYEWLSKQPQHYIISEGWGGTGLPADINAGEGLTLKQDMVPPEGGWKITGKLRIQAEKDMGDSLWTAAINGTKLKETMDRSEPYDNPYPQLLGNSKQHRAWTVPNDILKDGINQIEFSMHKGEGVKLVFVDLAVK